MERKDTAQWVDSSTGKERKVAKLVQAIMVLLLVTALISCSGGSEVYKKALEEKYNEFTALNYEFSDPLHTAVQSVASGVRPSIGLMQDKISELIKNASEIKGLVPPAQVKGKHDELVRKIVENADEKNELAMFLGTGQIDNATDAIQNLMGISKETGDLYDEIMEALE